jgi:ferric-dicitrate binding protein FerR (iron transport regulator)
MNEKQLKEIWDNNQHSVPEDQINDSLRSLLFRIDMFEFAQQNQSKTRKQIRFIYSLAGAIMLPLLIFSTLFFYNNRQPDVLVVNSTEYITPVGESRKIILDDGTVVFLNSGSVLIAPDRFTSDVRSVFLTGEAFFDVAKEKERSFIVKTSMMNIKVLGTEFSVMAYSHDNYIKTTLVEGSVGLETSDPLSKNIDPVILCPNQQSIYDPFMDKIAIADVDVTAYTSWKDGKLIFEKTPFSEVIHRLEIQSGAKITYDKQLREYVISAKFVRNEPLEEMLRLITEVTYSHYSKVDNNEFVIRP